MSEWLKETHDHPGAQWPVIQQRMKQIALNTLLAAQDTVDKRNRSFELFGCGSHNAESTVPAPLIPCAGVL